MILVMIPVYPTGKTACRGKLPTIPPNGAAGGQKDTTPDTTGRNIRMARSVAAGGTFVDGAWRLLPADLRKANLADINLSGADIRQTDLTSANLQRSNLSGANASQVVLSAANLSDADLSGADLRRAYAAWANLSGTNLAGANLNWADLGWSNLSESNLSGATLIGADLEKANLSGATIDGGRITHSVGWTPDGEWPVTIWATDAGNGIAVFGCLTVLFDSPGHLRSQTGSCHGPCSAARDDARMAYNDAANNRAN